MGNVVGKISGILTRKQKLAELGRKSVLDLEGKRFGRLMVVSRAGSRCRKALWLCRCDCGKEKVIWSRSLVGGFTRSCGCYRREVLKKLKTNPLMSDEERELQRERRIDPRTLEWRRKVYERDGYACQACGDDRGGNLVAHHKESWSRNKELRFDVDNGATSCKECHKEFHSIFGYGDNTADEWLVFLSVKGKKAEMPRRMVKRRKPVDLKGRRFGRLVVLEADRSKDKAFWICRCDCGEIRSIGERGLTRGLTNSCGCLKKENIGLVGKRNFDDLAGRRFGGLTVVVKDGHHSGSRWVCRCDCGEERIVWRKYLIGGKAVSCGKCRRIA